MRTITLDGIDVDTVEQTIAQTIDDGHPAVLALDGFTFRMMCDADNNRSVVLFHPSGDLIRAVFVPAGEPAAVVASRLAAVWLETHPRRDIVTVPATPYTVSDQRRDYVVTHNLAVFPLQWGEVTAFAAVEIDTDSDNCFAVVALGDRGGHYRACYSVAQAAVSAAAELAGWSTP